MELIEQIRQIEKRVEEMRAALVNDNIPEETYNQLGMGKLALYDLYSKAIAEMIETLNELKAIEDEYE